MMRLLFLCLLLLLPAATAVSEDTEGSADVPDDEDLFSSDLQRKSDHGLATGKTKGEDDNDHLTLIVIVVAATVLTLSVAAIVTVMLVRRHMQNREQGIYSVPTEQDQKRTISFMVE